MGTVTSSPAWISRDAANSPISVMKFSAATRRLSAVSELVVRAGQIFDRNLYRVAGIEPERMKILVNKSSVHYRADFDSIAEAHLVAKSPGPMAADPSDLPWTRIDPELRLRPNGASLDELHGSVSRGLE